MREINSKKVRDIAKKYNKNPNYVFVQLGLHTPEVRVLLLEGGTRSGKTYNTLLCLIELATRYCLGTVSIVRETMVSTRNSVERQFFNILTDLGLYREKYHNKSMHCYRLNDTLFEIFGADDPQKVRGSERDILFCNEVNGFKYYSFNELALRTKHKIICDYNPTILPNHFIYTTLCVRDDVMIFKSNYLDNIDHLYDSQIREFLSLKDTNYERYRSLVLGERVAIQGAIYPHWKIGVYERGDNEIAVMDLGYNDPTTITLMSKKYSLEYGREVFYVKNIYYERFKDISQVIKDMKELGLQDKLIVCDISPQVVNSLRAFGFKVLDAIKGNKQFTKVDAVKLFQSEQVVMDKDSYHLHTEQSSYCWLYDEKSGQFYDKLKDGNDHILDAILYGYMTVFSRKNILELNKRYTLEVNNFPQAKVF